MRATAARVHQMTKVCHHCIPLYLFIGSKNTAVLQYLLRISASWSMIIVLQFSNLVITAPTVDIIKSNNVLESRQRCELLHNPKHPEIYY